MTPPGPETSAAAQQDHLHRLQGSRICARTRSGSSAISYAGAVHLGLIAIVVGDYDPAISFFVDALGFELVEDSPALTNDGRPKRWVVVRPPDAATGLLLAQADGEDQAAIVGKQAAGRVGFFLHVEDFDAAKGLRNAALVVCGRRADSATAGSWHVQAFGRLSGDLGYEVEVLIEVQHRESGKFGRGGDDQIGD